MKKVSSVRKIQKRFGFCLVFFLFMLWCEGTVRDFLMICVNFLHHVLVQNVESIKSSLCDEIRKEIFIDISNNPVHTYLLEVCKMLVLASSAVVIATQLLIIRRLMYYVAMRWKFCIIYNVLYSRITTTYFRRLDLAVSSGYIIDIRYMLQH